MFLLVAADMPISAVAATGGISRRFVYKGVQRFLHEGLPGLADKPRPGRKSSTRPPALAGEARTRVVC
jgi:transposase